MPHDTLLKFNYPQTLLREYQHWAVLLRPKQVTVGSLVLICTDHSAYDWRFIAEHSRLIVDTRNALRSVSVDPHKVVKA